MSENGQPSPANLQSDQAFPSLPALHAGHLELVRRQREIGSPPALLADAAAFIRRGSATGVLLDAESDRETAQSLLDYWSTILFRQGHEPPDATLAEFDPTLTPALDDALCPYVGLDAFRERDSPIFFGRQRTTDELLALLGQRRLLAVVGPSGSGKSSVVRAGLLPALQAGALPGSATWRCYPPIVPGATPLASLARLFLRPGLGSAEIIARLRAGREQFAQLLAEAEVGTALICIDQFEEVFTLCDDEAERQAFTDSLLALIELPNAEHRVVLTMRSDFETFVARSPQLHEHFAAGRVPLTPLSAAELREAIERPAAQVGLKFEEGVIDALLHDLVGEPAALPLLQFTLLKLWEGRDYNRVTSADYQRLGGGRLALARSADEFYARLIPEEQITARRILLRMVRPGDGLEVTSNRIRRAEIYRANEARERIDRVLDKLITARLLRFTAGDTPDDAQIEVAHEALVRNWPTLVGWLDDERAALSTRRRLEAKAAEWVRLGRGSSALLDREQLLETEHWLASPEAEYLGFSPALPELAVASRAAIEEAEHEQEAARQRELTQARALADEQQRRAEAERARAEAERARAEAEARSNQRLKWLFRWLAVMAMLAVGAAFWAFAAQIQASNRANQLDAQVQISVTAQAKAVQNAQVASDNATTARQNAEVAQSNLQVAQTAQADANRLRNDAEQRRNLDRANLLAAVSGALAQNRPQLSILMAVEAVRVHRDLAQAPSITATLALTRTLIGAGAVERGFWRQQGAITAVAISADGARAISGSTQGAVWLWNLNEADPAAAAVELTGLTQAITRLAITPDGRLAIAGDSAGNLRVWQADAPTAEPRALPATSGPVTQLLISADGRRLLASGSNDTSVRVWSLANLDAAPLTLSRHSRPITAAAFSANGSLVLTGSADSTVLLWNLNARNPGGSLSNLKAREGRPAITTVAFSPRSDWAVTVAEDGVAHRWTVGNAQFQNGPRVVPLGSATVLRIDPLSRWLVVGNPNGTIDMRSASSLRLAYTLRGHSSTVSGLAFSRDGARMASSSADGTIGLWDLSGNGQPALLRVLRGHEGVVNALALSDDGARLVSGGDDQSVREWAPAAPIPAAADLPADPAELVALACRVAGRNMTTDEWRQYFDGQGYRATCAP